jgi:hypothetical protein
MRKPGTYLLLMAWWIVPFFILALASYPVGAYLTSYVPFLAAFVIIPVCAFILAGLDARLEFWERFGFWKRYFVLTGAYALTMVIVLAVTVTLDFYGLAGYFRGDAAGSFGMLYIPSVVFYFVSGALFCAAASFLQRSR